MRVAVKNHALPVYKKNRIASLLCIFESTISGTTCKDLATTDKVSLRTRNSVHWFSYNSIVKSILPLRFNPFRPYGIFNSHQMNQSIFIKMVVAW